MAPEAESHTITLANWMESPNSKWSYRNVTEILPCATISKGTGGQSKQTTATPISLNGFRITDAEGNTINLAEFHNVTATDGFLVQRNSRILHEEYFNGNTATTPHILMSTTKSFIGLLLGTLASEDVIDPDASVSTYLPELASTAYGPATPRHLIDMRAGAKVDMWEYGYRTAMGWEPVAPDKPGAKPDLPTYFATLDTENLGHGGAFHYLSNNTDLLGLVLEKATGQRLPQLLSERLWAPIGAEADAAITVDASGLGRAAGGMCATVRDFAKCAQMVADGGVVEGVQVLPHEVIEDTLQNGSKEAWEQGQLPRLFEAGMYDGTCYRNGWYVVERQGRKSLHAIGLNGQHLFVDPEMRLVVAKTSCHPNKFDVFAMRLAFKAFEEIRRIVNEEDGKSSGS